tara:strand:+ start:546 stop:743 length:198 start_codon:yes stop_codon:yes gene_type:complete
MAETNRGVAMNKAKGPKPDRVKIDMDWEDAVNKALKKERPKEGWPELGKKSKQAPDEPESDKSKR